MLVCCVFWFNIACLFVFYCFDSLVIVLFFLLFFVDLMFGFVVVFD